MDARRLTVLGRVPGGACPDEAIVVGVGGASGQPYADRVLRFLSDHHEELGLDVHVVFSKMGRLVWRDEVRTDPKSYGFPIYAPGDMTAPFASG